MAAGASPASWTKHVWFPDQHGTPDAALPRLYCIHWAGGHAAMCRTWFDALSGIVQPVAVQLPGRMFHAPQSQHVEIETLLADLVPVFADHADRPYLIFGHSMGALVGFELVRALRRVGQRMPLALLVSGHRAAHLPDPNKPLAQLPDAAFMARLQALGGIPREAMDSEELQKLLIPVARADFALCESYRYLADAPLDCAIVALCGASDPRVSPDEAERWEDLTSSAFACSVLPGGHFFLLEDHEAFVSELTYHLERAVAAEQPA